MFWKKRGSNLIVVSFLSVIYTAISLLLLIGPLHMNAEGNINQLGNFPIYIACYWIASLVLTWTLYLYFKNKAEFTFFALIIVGVVIILIEICLWRGMGL